MGTVHWSWICVSCTGKEEAVNRRYTILPWFADYNRSLQVEASANDFVRTPGSIPEEALKQLQQFVKWKLQKESAASTASEQRM